jgi:hypothetical protein
MDKKFSLKNFIEKEAEEELPLKNKNSDPTQLKDTQYSNEIDNEENDSYGIPSDNDTEKINSEKASKELITHTLLLQKEIKENEKRISNKTKRKRIVPFEKKDNRKRIVEHIKKNHKKIEESVGVLGIVNGKLNIRFAENKENKNINDEDAKNKNEKTPEKKFEDEDDEEIHKLKQSDEKRTIENVNKKINDDFIKRLKDNENFIKNNNIIIGDGTGFNKDILKRNKSDISLNIRSIQIKRKLKLYSFKGAFLNKNKKK